MKAYLSRTEHIVYFIILIIMMFIAKSVFLEYKIADFGFGLQDYANQKLLAQNFIKNWPTSISSYDFSIVMRVQLGLTRILGLPAINYVMYVFVFLYCILFVMGGYFLSRSLFADDLTAFLCTAVILVAPMAGLNLSNHGHGLGNYSPHLYYGFSHAFVFFCLGFFFKNRLYISVLFLILATLSHAITGMFCALFIASYGVFFPKVSLRKDYVLASLVYIVFFTVIFLFLYQTGGVKSEIPSEMWVKLSRIFSFHWHPVYQGRLYERAHTHLIPLLFSVYFFFVFRDSLSLGVSKEIQQKITSGFIGISVLSIIGILFSDVFPVVSFVRASLQRSAFLLTLISTLFIIAYAYKALKFFKLEVRLAALMTIFLYILADPGIALLPLLLLARQELYAEKKEKNYLILKTIFIFLCLLSLFSLLMDILILLQQYSLLNLNLEKIFSSLPRFLHHFTLHRDFDLNLFGGTLLIKNKVWALLISLFFLFLFFQRKMENRDIPAYSYKYKKVFVCSVILASFAAMGIQEKLWYKSNYNKSLSYKEAQLWANKNTGPDALFMIDPSRSHGWRDFSQRSCFGTLMEWGHLTHIYTSNYELYKEGLKRMNVFGVDIRNIKNEDIFTIDSNEHGNYGSLLKKKIFLRYNMLSQQEIQHICKQFSINYIIFDKEAQKNEKELEKIEKVYENKHYRIYKVN